VIYEHIKDYILDIIKEHPIGNGKIAILGGIQINIRDNYNWFEPKMFMVLDKNGTEDHTKEVFNYMTEKTTNFVA
jgi:hypothetical protein